MVSEEAMFAAFQEAIERAGTEVLTWIPEKVGDRLAGRVIDLGSVSHDYGVSPTTTHEIYGVDYVENGEHKSAFREGGKPQLVRVAWIGAVLEAQYDRMRPVPRDFCAFEYQTDVQPKNTGFNPYKLINAVVLDGTTALAKVPVNYRIVVPTAEMLAATDPRTGFIPDVGRNPLTPRPDEPALEATSEETEAAKSTGGRFRRQSADTPATE